MGTWEKSDFSLYELQDPWQEVVIRMKIVLTTLKICGKKLKALAQNSLGSKIRHLQRQAAFLDSQQSV